MPIQEWSKDDRPREKLLKYGEHIHYSRRKCNNSTEPAQLHCRCLYLTGANNVT
jgi:hypothetical protein